MTSHADTRKGTSRSRRVDSWKRTPSPGAAPAPEPSAPLPTLSPESEVKRSMLPGELLGLAPAAPAAPAAQSRPESQSQTVTVEPSSDFDAVRAAAARVADLESRIQAEQSRADEAERREAEARALVAEERRERQVTTAAILHQLQTANELALDGGTGPMMIAAPTAPEVRSSRRFAYAMAAASCLAVVVLGWRLASIDGDLAHANERIETVAEEKAAAQVEASRLAGEANAARESLRDERQRTSELEQLAAEAQASARKAEAIAASALGAKVMLQTVATR